MRQDGALCPPGRDLERFRARDHVDGVPWTIFHAELATDANVEIDFYELLVLVKVRTRDCEYAIDRAELDADLTARATGLVHHSKLLRTLFCLYRRRRGNRAYNLIRHETVLQIWKN
jgi:hypothetical protein